MKFYRCKHCGNIIVRIEDAGVPVVCCGEKMEDLVANSTDAAGEKHVPVVSKNETKIDVTVGSVPHPMMEAHSIKWIVLETEKGYQIKYLNYTDVPSASFIISEGDNIIAAYEYCSLHGLWKCEL